MPTDEALIENYYNCNTVSFDVLHDRYYDRLSSFIGMLELPVAIRQHCLQNSYRFIQFKERQK